MSRRAEVQLTKQLCKQLKQQLALQIRNRLGDLTWYKLYRQLENRVDAQLYEHIYWRLATHLKKALWNERSKE